MIQERLDAICKNRKINENGTKVTISKDDFLWLVYGVTEQNEKVDELEKKIDVAIDELGYAWRTGNDGLKDEYIKNAIRFLEGE